MALGPVKGLAMDSMMDNGIPLKAAKTEMVRRFADFGE